MEGVNSLLNATATMARATSPPSCMPRSKPSAYSASKAGLDAIIRAIALEAAPHGIRINNINPGVIDTPMLPADGDEIVTPLAARAALGRIGTPADIADAAVWLCSFITGQSILVDGGFTIPGPL